MVVAHRQDQAAAVALVVEAHQVFPAQQTLGAAVAVVAHQEARVALAVAA